MKSKSLGYLLRALFSGVLTAVLVFGTVGQASAASVIYVKRDATGANDGTSWSNAYTNLQTALSRAVAGSGTQIWVAKGMYKPSRRTNALDPRTKIFSLKNGVGLYGGFAGYEALLSQRNLSLNPTTLSGNIGSSTITTDNAYHVVSGNGTNSTAILDGFIIQGGRADGAGSAAYGGGMYISSGSPSLRNLTFKGNFATSGGGLWISGGSPSFTGDTFNSNHATAYGGGLYASGIIGKFSRVTFSGNSADLDGGGMFVAGGSQLKLANVTFSVNTAANNGGGLFDDSSAAALTYGVFRGNTAINGGGMYGTNLSITSLSNVSFGDNVASVNGGGLYIHESGPVLSKITFRFNVASANGGGIFNESLSASPTLSDVTFNGNNALANSGGMYNAGNNPLLNNTTFAFNAGAMYNNNSDPTIKNSIVYSNGPTEFVDSSSNVVLIDSIVKGATPGAFDCLGDGSNCTNVINSNPVLGSLRKNGGFTETMSLGVNSPAIDAGGGHAACVGRDQRGVARPQGAACDIGAYEVRVRTFVSEAAYDGWVLENGQGSGVGGDADSTADLIQVGDDASNRQERGFLSFDTTNLPDAAEVVIANVKLKSAGGIWDTVPFTTHGALWIDLARPSFGDYPDLSGGDFEASATIGKAGTIGSTLSGGFYMGALTSTGRNNINRTGRTQLRLRFNLSTDNDSKDDYIFLVSSDNSTDLNRPRLILYYNP